MQKHLSVKVRNGLKTSLWFDDRLHVFPLYLVVNNRVFNHSRLGRNAKVSDLCHQGVWKWPDFSRGFIELQSIPLSPPSQMRRTDVFSKPDHQSCSTIKSGQDLRRSKHLKMSSDNLIGAASIDADLSFH